MVVIIPEVVTHNSSWIVFLSLEILTFEYFFKKSSVKFPSFSPKLILWMPEGCEPYLQQSLHRTTLNLKPPVDYSHPNLGGTISPGVERLTPSGAPALWRHLGSGLVPVPEGHSHCHFRSWEYFPGWGLCPHQSPDIFFNRCLGKNLKQGSFQSSQTTGLYD